MNINNEIVNRLPKHLHKYIVDQNYDAYTPVDHAVWRYIMKINLNNLCNTAHQSYIDGLKKTGISIEKIPNISEMNSILAEIGWAAVCVDGFIPPAAFMEFQAYNILVIAAEIRSVEHIGYTPAPDIVHEAAGHAPIIADPAYAEYLRLFGEIGSKAIRSKKDFELYEAIRQLSILKENTSATKQQIADAEGNIIAIQNDMGELSEMSKIRNLHWWTVEYGLIGTIDNPKIYGAGILSSLTESNTCLNNEITKIPYTIEAANYNFDITTQQPQLFVTPDFSHLSTVLNEFADTMALRNGGADGIRKAIDSTVLATCELTSGLQISGIFTNLITDDNDNVVYVQTTGPTILCEREKMLIGHSTSVHGEGYGSPVGKIIGIDKKLEDMRIKELEDVGITIGDYAKFNFESGVSVSGLLHHIRKNKYGKILLITFKDCTVTYKNEYLFKPEWGQYDMGVGESVTSVFAGVADRDEYESDLYISDTSTVSNPNHDNEYYKLYSMVREVRETESNYEILEEIFLNLKNNYKDDWLLSLEIYEICNSHLGESYKLTQSVLSYLNEIAEENPKYKNLILVGLNLLNKS